MPPFTLLVIFQTRIKSTNCSKLAYAKEEEAKQLKQEESQLSLQLDEIQVDERQRARYVDTHSCHPSPPSVCFFVCTHVLPEESMRTHCPPSHMASIMQIGHIATLVSRPIGNPYLTTYDSFAAFALHSAPHYCL